MVILNYLEVRGKYFTASLDTLNGTIPVYLLPDPSSRKSITVVTYADEDFLKCKTICFTDGSKLDGKVFLTRVIYEDGAE